jgi:hypothetical protein
MALVAAAVGLAGAGDAAAEIVTTANLGVDWFNAPPEVDTRAGGTVVFDAGPATPPLGRASLHVETDCLNPPSCGLAKAQMFTFAFGSFGELGSGVRLADIDGLTYWTYRDSASTNPITQVITLNAQVDWAGDGSTFTTLVYEPYYNGPSWAAGDRMPAIATDAWQLWDAIDSGHAIWWSTSSIPGLPAFTFLTTWAEIVAANPDAVIKYGFGFNAGSGWTGQHFGAVDALELTVGGARRTFNFEVPLPVRIDLRPGTTDRQVNVRARQLVPIAILGDAAFDARDVDPESVLVRGASPTADVQYEDVDGDGFVDLLLRFRARDFDEPTGAECDDPDAVILLTAFLLDGETIISGTDAVRWIGPACP